MLYDLGGLSRPDKNGGYVIYMQDGQQVELESDILVRDSVDYAPLFAFGCEVDTPASFIMLNGSKSYSNRTWAEDSEIFDGMKGYARATRMTHKYIPTDKNALKPSLVFDYVARQSADHALNFLIHGFQEDTFEEDFSKLIHENFDAVCDYLTSAHPEPYLVNMILANPANADDDMEKALCYAAGNITVLDVDALLYELGYGKRGEAPTAEDDAVVFERFSKGLRARSSRAFEIDDEVQDCYFFTKGKLYNDCDLMPYLGNGWEDLAKIAILCPTANDNHHDMSRVKAEICVRLKQEGKIPDTIKYLIASPSISRMSVEAFGRAGGVMFDTEGIDGNIDVRTLTAECDGFRYVPAPKRLELDMTVIQLDASFFGKGWCDDNAEQDTAARLINFLEQSRWGQHDELVAAFDLTDMEEVEALRPLKKYVEEYANNENDKYCLPVVITHGEWQNDLFDAWIAFEDAMQEISPDISFTSFCSRNNGRWRFKGGMIKEMVAPFFAQKMREILE